MNTLQDFLTNKQRNAWIHFKGYDLYLRKSHRFIDHHLTDVLDLANIKADTPGEGQFLPLLNEIKTELSLSRPNIKGIVIESILNDRFLTFHLRNGFKKMDGHIPPSVIQLF